MPEVDFGTLASANDVRDRYENYLCSDDDRRLRAVTFSSDTPEGVLEAIRNEAMEDRAVTDRRSETAPLTERDREKISELDGFTNQATTFSWRSAKGVFAREGLTEQFEDAIGYLTDYDDPAEGAEEYVQEARRSDHLQGTSSASGGSVDHGAEELKQQKAAASAARRAQAEGCDHARGHCEHGDPEACQYLQEACGLDEEEVEQLLEDPEGADRSEQAIEGPAAGALRRAWSGYKGATADLEEQIEQLGEDWQHAQQAARAINRVREAHGQDPLHFEKLEAAQGRLQDLQRRAAADCHECHADHAGHDHAGPEREQLASDGGDEPDVADVGVWEVERDPENIGGDDHEAIQWRHERDRMDGGTELVMVSPDPEDTETWRIRVGNLDELTAKTIASSSDREEMVRQAAEWVAEHPQGTPPGFSGPEIGTGGGDGAD